MATFEADVGQLTSSAQIFASSRSLPQIRALHKTLNGQVDDKAARLRTQVGGSYRELLGTADSIVQMRGDMDAVRATLASMGNRCGRAAVGAKVNALATFASSSQAGRDHEKDSLSVAARARLLEACARTVARLLSRSAATTIATNAKLAKQQQPQKPAQTWGERLVLAAKVLVLSRLLITSLAEDKSKTESKNEKKSTIRDPTVRISIEASKKTLASLRRRLRDMVEVLERTVHHRHYDALVAARTGVDGAVGDAALAMDLSTTTHTSRAAAAAAARRDDLLRALCAYSLATTSGARDVLWQLLHTLLDVQALLPHRLPEALLGLKRRALLDDESLQQMEGLALDVHGRWCGDDVQFFKPYIRHDDLDAAQARDMLGTWAERGADALLAGLQRALGGVDGAGDSQKKRPGQAQLDLHAIVDMRRRVLQLWIRDSSRVRGLDPAALLDRIRLVLGQHMQQVLEAKVDKLRLVGSEVASTVASWRDSVADRHASLWGGGSLDVDVDVDVDVGLDTDLSSGAVPFVWEVVGRLHGRSDAVARAVASFATWRRVMDDAEAVVAQLRRQRWELEEGDDDDEHGDGLVEDEDTIAQRQQLLSRDDPTRLQGRLEAALATAFADLDRQMARTWAQLGTEANDGQADRAMYLVRVLREIRAGGGERVASLGLAIIPELHDTIVRSVTRPALEQFVAGALARRTVAGRSLWELDRDSEKEKDEKDEKKNRNGLVLPPSPSPGVFRFLRDLSTAMSRAGMDLWSPTAVAVLKRHVAADLAARWIAVWLLDAAWLHCCFGSAGQQPWMDLEELLAGQSGLTAEAAARQRIIKTARDSWKKTSLLFGVL
ncbi:hypothetical protein CMQ_4805 [Grosmannia clavigera kw1407]|uniref:Conserved oligomeric Golgi complex subunit 1 n=1 Tax=Grosmannia clavigera (strain kw1407 / UAMH 11150) TaxID=655863 RepID=F0XUH4_GROCL|nr:uncharacterized protein CMQ_4805 [Grosmannia clavigera kw1407]EFW98953.1 hypothetical protein CMQ_4805 [Grosmannia clavigera kw1407]